MIPGSEGASRPLRDFASQTITPPNRPCATCSVVRSLELRQTANAQRTGARRSAARWPAATSGGALIAWKLSPLGAGDYHVDRSTPASRAHEPILPIENAGSRAILSRHLDGVGLDPVPARLAPNDQPHARRSGVAQRHRRSGMRFHMFADREREMGVLRLPTKGRHQRQE